MGPASGTPRRTDEAGDDGRARADARHHRTDPRDHTREAPVLFAYIGPETMLPLASVVMAAVGGVLMFGRNALAFGRNLVRRVLGR